MTHPLESNHAAAGAPVLPLQLLQPLDATHPFSTPASNGGPHQRLTVSPDPGVGAELDLRPTRLLIRKDGQIRSIWPVHLAGWQQLGWQLHTPAETPADGLELEEPEETEQVEQPQAPEGLPAPQVLGPQPLAPASPTPAADPPPADAAPVAGEAVLAGEVPNFQAMTKAEITAFCASTFGVSLDGSMTKAELVASATALLQGTQPQGAPSQGAEPTEAMPAVAPPDPAAGEEGATADDLGFQGEGTDPEFPDDLI
jgi:hypothetical protein